MIFVYAMLVMSASGALMAALKLERISVIAAASFFLGQADELPESLRIMPLLCTPVLLVLLLMVYWLVRVLFTQWRPRT